MINNLSKISDKALAGLVKEIRLHKSLGNVLSWATANPKNDFCPQIVAEVITQDEFTHDVIVPYRNLFLVYDTT